MFSLSKCSKDLFERKRINLDEEWINLNENDSFKWKRIDLNEKALISTKKDSFKRRKDSFKWKSFNLNEKRIYLYAKGFIILVRDILLHSPFVYYKERPLMMTKTPIFSQLALVPEAVTKWVCI